MTLKPPEGAAQNLSQSSCKTPHLNTQPALPHLMAPARQVVTAPKILGPPARPRGEGEKGGRLQAQPHEAGWRKTLWFGSVPPELAQHGWPKTVPALSLAGCGTLTPTQNHGRDRLAPAGWLAPRPSRLLRATGAGPAARNCLNRLFDSSLWVVVPRLSVPKLPLRDSLPPRAPRAPPDRHVNRKPDQPESPR